MKELLEKRNALIEEMEGLVKTAKTETRSLNEDELSRIKAIKEEIRGIDETIKIDDEMRVFEKKTDVKTVETREVLEERSFENYIRGIVEQRADVNMTVGDNGAIIPTSIANKIIKKVVDICPIFQLATRYNIGGTLTIPSYDESTQAITMAYASEFTELESKGGKFTSIELKGFLAGALTKVSKSLINNNAFDIVNFVISAMAETIAKFIEKELLNGTTDKVAGLSGVTQKVTTASATALTADELIDLQEEVPDVYQENAIYIMNKATRKAIRKLRDGQGNYLLNKDFNAKWGYTLLGKDVYTSDNMSKIEAGKTVIHYGDISGLAVKVAEEVNIEVLREKYATQHAVGIVAWVELDSKVENAQKIASLVMKSA